MEETVDKQYLKGFNNGYVLARHEPDLLKKIVSNKNEKSEYFRGLVSGKQQHDVDKVRSRFKTVVHGTTLAQENKIGKGRNK